MLLVWGEGREIQMLYVRFCIYTFKAILGQTKDPWKKPCGPGKENNT